MKIIQPYCSGKDCPLRKNCNHYSTVIDVKKDLFFDSPPYNPRTKSCGFFPKNLIDAPVNGQDA